MFIFRGSLPNVLERFQKAARLYCKPNDVIIRLCADSPLLDQALLQDFSDNIKKEKSFFSTRYLDEDIFVSTTGKGNNIDALTVSELVNIKGDSELIREHIVYGFDYGDKFSLYHAKESYNENECIDTVEDYQRLL